MTEEMHTLLNQLNAPSKTTHKYVSFIKFILCLYLLFIFYVYFFLHNSSSAVINARIEKGGLLSVANIIPLKTIFIYIVALFENTMNKDIIIRNLLVPIIVWLPAGFFGYSLFSCYRLKKHIAVFILTITVLFGLRVYFHIGYFDVDKIILSVSAYCLAYQLCKYYGKNVLPFSLSR